MVFKYLYNNKKCMKKEKTRKPITIVIDKNLYNIIDEKFSNKSKYINWLIYQDLLKNTNDEELKKILL